MRGERRAVKAICPANKGDAAGDRADDDRWDRSRTAVIGGKACGDASEEWKRLDRQGEQQPAEVREADKS